MRLGFLSCMLQLAAVTSTAAQQAPAPAAEPVRGEAAVAAAPAPESEPVMVPTPPPAAAPGTAGVRLPPAVWVTGLAVIVILILYFFAGH